VKLLAGFSGVLQVDGYAVYKRLARPTRTGQEPDGPTVGVTSSTQTIFAGASPVPLTCYPVFFGCNIARGGQSDVVEHRRQPDRRLRAHRGQLRDLRSVLHGEGVDLEASRLIRRARGARCRPCRRRKVARGESWSETVRTLRRDRPEGGSDRIAIGETVSGNFQNAVYSVAALHKLDGAPELIGYQVTDHTGAVAATRLWNDRGTAALLPIDAQVALAVFILLLPTRHQHPTVFIR
jgi:hypothetical protein